MKTKTNAIVLSVLWTIILLLFPISSGIITTIFTMNQVQIFLIQGAFMALAIMLAFLYFKKSKQKLFNIGFKKPEPKSEKSVFYFLPLLLILLPFFVVGVDFQSAEYFFSLLFFALMVGIAEEIYFRAIVYNFVNKAFLSKISIILVVSLIFAFGHSASIIGNGNLVSTILQVLNAFFFGIVAMQVVILTKSLFPTMIFHFLYNFSNHISLASGTTEIVCVVIRVVLTIITAVVFMRSIKKAEASQLSQT